jgi:hypothetical protein
MLNKGKEKAKATRSKESQKSSLQERAKNNDERNMEISDESPTPHPGPSTRSRITETLPANMSKVAQSCRVAQESENRKWSDRVGSHFLISLSSDLNDVSPLQFLTFFKYLGRDWAQSPALQNDIKVQVGKAMTSRDVEVRLVHGVAVAVDLIVLNDWQKQIKNDMHVIVKYVYWMKKRRGTVKLQEQSEVGFKVLFELLQMRS